MVNTLLGHWKSVKRWSYVFGIVLVALSVIAEWSGLWHVHFIGYDYAFFYYAFHAVLDHKVTFHHMYNLQLQQHWLALHHFPVKPYNQYVYPPQFAVLFALFGVLPFGLSFALWMLMSLSLYFLGIYCLIKLFWQRIRRLHLIGLFIVAAILDPFQIDLAVGNVNSMLFALLSISFYLLYKKERPAWAGILIGLTILMKVTPAAALLIMAMRREWKVCQSAGVTVGTGTLLSMFIVGIGPIFTYIQHFSTFGHTSMKNGPAPFNQSIVGVLSMFIQHHALPVSKAVPTVVYVLMCVTVLLVIYIMIVRRKLGDWRVDVALSSLSVVFFSPLIEEPHLVFAIPAVIALLSLGKSLQESESSSTVYRFGKSLYAVSIASAVLLSLPVAILFNSIVRHFPQLYFIHIQMFVVLIMLFSITLRTYAIWNPSFAAAGQHLSLTGRYGAKAGRSADAKNMSLASITRRIT